MLLLVFAFANTFEFVIIIFLAGFRAEVGDAESGKMKSVFDKLTLKQEC